MRAISVSPTLSGNASNVAVGGSKLRSSLPVALISDRAYSVEVWQGGKWVTHPTAPEFSLIEEAEKWAEQVCGNTRVLPVDRQTNQLQRRFFTPTVKLFEVAR
ncbi:MAG: hypothetical protein M3P26_15770 [Gemmatimonadota bacterium]|nr:hypothetical protein [Gemmatimonadota bacterium]